MKIIYENLDKTVVVLHPTVEVLEFFTIETIAEKDVPHNLPYWIVEDSIIPSDRTFRNAWEIDASIGEPHGFGGESDEFDPVLLAEWRVQNVSN